MHRAWTAALAAVALSCSSTPAPPPPLTVAIAPITSDPAPVLVTEPSASARAPRAHAGTATSIAWETDERAARERSRRQGMPMLVWVRADWAAAALEMERKAWSDPRVMAMARDFVALKLDVTEAEGDAELYAQRYGVDVMPETLFFDASGRKVGDLRGVTDAEALVAAMKRASE